MRVCILVSKYPISGGGQVNLDYIKKFYTDNGINVKIYTKCGLYIKSPFRFLKFIKNNKIDVIQTIDIKPEFIFNTLFARLSGKKIIFSCVGKISEEQSLILRLISNIIANKITVLSKSFINKFLFRNKIIFVPNGIDLTKFSPNLGKRSSTIISVGRIDPIKNFEMIIRSAKSVENKILIIGPIYRDEYYKKLHNLVKELGANNVNFIHDVPHSSIHNYYKKSAIFVLTSKYEMFPAVILEAMACGMPVITTKIPNVSDVVKDNVIYVGNAEELSESMKILLNDKKLYRKMQLNGIKLSKKYDIKNMLESYRDVLFGVCNE